MFDLDDVLEAVMKICFLLILIGLALLIIGVLVDGIFDVSWLHFDKF